MKNLIALFSIICLLASCRKDVLETPPAANPPAVNSANDYFKLTVGNYWVYDNVKIDTLNVETILSSTDSAYVSADTVYRGNTYHELFDFYYTVWLRDSSGFMVDTTGKIYFTNQVFDLPLAFNYFGGSLGYSESMTVSSPVSVAVPAGTFNSYDWKTTAHCLQPSYPWAPIRYGHDYYSLGIGKVKQEYFYYSQPDRYERRLTHYHVH